MHRPLWLNLLTVVPPHRACAGLGGDWLYNPAADSCVKLELQPMLNPSEAEQHCQSLHLAAGLVVITSSAENDWIKLYLTAILKGN